MTTQELLTGLTLYPLPQRVLTEAALRRGCDLTSEATQSILLSREYNLTKADLLRWLALAPQVSQGGQSYNFTDEQRQQFRNEAQALLSQYDDSTRPEPVYGYKGSRL